MSGKYHGETLSDDESAIDVAELPIDYRMKLNGFLRSACHDGHETLTRVLLDKGADVNYITTNTQLSTALHVAVSNTNDKILPALISKASSTTIQSALQYAIQYQSKLANIIRLLQKDGTPTPGLDLKQDKDTGEKAPQKVDPPPQKETETQTTPPSQTETETQTQGEPEPHQKVQEQELKQEQLPGHKQEQLPVHKQDHQPDNHEQQQQLLQQQQQQQQQKQQQLQQQKSDELESQLRKLNDQLNAQEKVTQKLNEQLSTQESVTKKLNEQVLQQETQIQQFKKQIEELEKENKELTSNFDSYTKKSEASVLDFQSQITVLQKDIELKVRKIEKVSKERDQERRAKEVAKRILSSNGPRETPDNIGHSHAVRMGSLQSESPNPPNGTSGFEGGESDHDANLDANSDGNGKTVNGNGVATTTSDGDHPNVATNPTGNAATPGGKAVKPNNAGDLAGSPRTKSMNPKNQGRAKDDMDIASEADRARVRRLVERWEEMKFLEKKFF